MYFCLNVNLKLAVDEIITASKNETAAKLFFIDGPRGTGKTFYLQHIIFICSVQKISELQL